MGWVLDRYLHYEAILLEWIKKSSFLEVYTRDPISSRITLFLLTMGTFAFINELYITLEMTFIQKETYAELRLRKLDEALKQHRLLVDDTYHGREYVDDKSGIVIEEFESKEKFFAKPVHVAHLYIDCRVVFSNLEAAAEPVGLLKFHIEFSPEEYEHEKRPEFGATLGVLRRRLYNLFKDTETYKMLEKESKEPFTISKGVKIYNRTGEELPGSLDDIQLCFVRIETGDTINCEFYL